VAALAGHTETAARHYGVAIGCHRRLGARPMLAHALREYAQLSPRQADGAGLPEASGPATGAGA